MSVIALFDEDATKTNFAPAYGIRVVEFITGLGHGNEAVFLAHELAYLGYKEEFVVLSRDPGPTDITLHFHHTYIAFSPIFVKRPTKVVHKCKHVLFVFL